MNKNEIVFVTKFLSQLVNMDIAKFPFKTKEYRSGIHAMKDYFKKNKDRLGKKILDIESLFYNNGQNLTTIIMGMCGSYISFENSLNSLHTNVIIQICRNKANVILSDNELCDIPNDFIEDITHVFCHAVNI